MDTSRPSLFALTVLMLSLAACWCGGASVGYTAPDETSGERRPAGSADKVRRPATKSAAPGSARPPRFPADLKVVNDIVYKQVGDAKLDLMLLLPQEKPAKKSPLVVYIHGGGWGGGDKYKVLRHDIIEVVRGLSQHGIPCASIEYRLADGNPNTVLESITDCKDAVRFLAKHADEYGLDPQRIGTFGSSAGGHLTLLTALSGADAFPGDPALAGVPLTIRCVAAYYPLVSFVDRELAKGSNFENPRRLVPILGGPLEEKRQLAEQLSPLELIRADSPAIFLAHGDSDRVLSFQNAVRMRDAAQAKGVPVECIIAKGADHGLSDDGIEPPLAEITARAVAFFLKYLEK